MYINDEIIFNTPLGNIKILSKDEEITRIDFTRNKTKKSNSLILNNAKIQLKEYILGKRTTFDITANPNGTNFQKKVWKALSLIPFGKTVSYLNLSILLKTSPRAIGNACGKNPLLIVIPCHRVLSIKGKLNGFSALGGITTKKKLLEIENIKI
ncbi:MAG: Methylated-DNA--protein-cysteine methyltransferase [Alphaproteobacteria bacterium MarineAlpha9_Bin3]|nr:MAG: Methylated-DNA--protein-cysteine methyltransferase [Alphaproteobacteria bacterium MarineAlpha9_Bin3]|tara:strand:- start:6695 stop:7156 length:462 start_codon:yes stop_codon:yes gene_type:complete